MEKTEYKTIEGEFKGNKIRVNIFDDSIELFYWKDNDIMTIEKLKL